VGGDYLDILTLPTGNLVMVVADVAGKGLASALVSASFRSAFRAMAVAGVPLEEAASRLNELHCGESSETRQRYVTAMFLRLDPSEHRIEVVNAGHNPGFLCNPSGYYKLLEASGPPVGLLSGMQYQTEEFQLEPGGRVMLYTDGLVEVFRGGEEFGMERLFRRFQNFPMAAFRSMLQNIWAELADFASSPDPSDDMTALALLRTDAVEAFA
jgi:serine phosphatase RsbU (regulator of sigma subunit)